MAGANERSRMGTMSNALLEERTPKDRNITVHFATLAQAVMDALGFDPKFMRSGFDMEGALKKREFNPNRDLSVEEIGFIPQNISIYKHKSLFVLERCERPFQLVSYSKIGETKARYTEENSRNCLRLCRARTGSVPHFSGYSLPNTSYPGLTAKL